MRKIVSFVVLCLVMAPAFAVSGAGSARRNVASKMNSDPRATASVNQLNAMAYMSNMSVSVSGNGGGGATDDTTTSPDTTTTPDTPDTPDDITPDTPAEPDNNTKEDEKNACIRGNIGIGNTFVWASRYSNLNDYSVMVEDVDEPANNACFVRVEMKSTDSRVNVSDIPAKYFELGRIVTCGSWADEKTLEKRILDAKKSARTWGTVTGAVGGAAVGVGAMELFGNKLIGGAVEGQKGLERDNKKNELLYSQMAVLKKNDVSKYNEIKEKLQQLKSYCEDTRWTDEVPMPQACKDIDYAYILTVENK